MKEEFEVDIDSNFKSLKIELILHRINRQGYGNINFIIDDKANSLIIKHIKSDLAKINEKNISTNLINTNTNEDNIAYNLSEINRIKNNIPKTYLKNIYNILLYNKKTQIDFKNLFYEKVFDVDTNINDFIELDFKILLEYEAISNRNYVKTIYEIFDENFNSLYIKSANNDEFSFFSNKVVIDEYIFYNFNKNIKEMKFVIKFQMVLSGIIKLWYIKNDNCRLVIKNYGL